MIPDKLFINLKILSKIQKNGRITRSSDGVIALENESFYQSVKRFVTSDSRKQAIFEINSIINETIDCLNNIVNSKFMNKMYSNTDEYYRNCETMSLILNEFSSARVGIENLKFTYTSDANTSSQLDILIIKINSSIKDMKHKLQYFESFLPQTYKTEINALKNTEPSYYINETTSVPVTLSPELNEGREQEQFDDDQEEFDDEEQFDDQDFMNDNFNNIIDMNNIV